MDYMPGASSLAATRRGKMKNLRMSVLRSCEDPRACILQCEKETLAHDATMKKTTQGKCTFRVLWNISMYEVGYICYKLTYTALIREHEAGTCHFVNCSNTAVHLDEYSQLGHPYIRGYSITSEISWVLSTSPLQAALLGKAECMEVDVTYRASVEFEYLLNAVVFNYTTLRCKLQCT